MPADPRFDRRTPPTPRALLAAAAAQALDLQPLLAALAARQLPPITANRCQRAPNAPECPEMSHLFEALPAPASPSTCQPLPNPANARHDERPRKTNPNPQPSSIFHPPSSSSHPPRPLTPDQLRAARLLLAGQSTNAIAAALSINRHTLGKWKRLPLFQQELRYLLAIPTPNS